MELINVSKSPLRAYLVALLFVSMHPVVITEMCEPNIIAHRGASGYVPEHTLGAYALAVTMGADYVEPDLVMTRDAQLVARHDNELGLSTDVAARAEFAGRYRTQLVDGAPVSGWFTEDFTLQEIKTLRAVERIPATRPGNARMDRSYEIPTFEEIIELVKSMQFQQKRIIGIYPEIKHSTHFKRLGLPMERLLVDKLHRYGYRGRRAAVYIQSFEVGNLKELKNMTDLRLVQLFEGDQTLQPYDQKEAGSSLTYGDMATSGGLAEVSKYADAVGPDKSYIIPRDADNKLGNVTSFVEDAQAVGLNVHPYTFRAENVFLPAEYRSEDAALDALGNLRGEISAYLATGIDGLFTDQPDIAFSLRGPCENVVQGKRTRLQILRNRKF